MYRFALSAILILPLVCSCATKIKEIEIFNSETGNTKKYHKVGESFTHDLSGAATNGINIITVDDGGKGSKYNFARSIGKDLNQSIPFRLTRIHKDLESATYQNGYYIVATSFSKNLNSFNLVTRFRWDGSNVESEQTVNLKSHIMSALKKNFPSKWYNFVSKSKARQGGLNIEGMTISGQDDSSLIFGLRSPLFGDIKKDLSAIQKNGKAILASVANAFGDKPSISFREIDLNGHGVRGMEYIPYISGYIIIGGPTFKANDYSLWFLPLFSDVARPLTLKGFEKLCRPEAVIPDYPDGIIIFSEASGEACQNSSISYIKAKIIL